MYRFSLLVLAFLTFPLAAQAQNAWINEFHYDNVGTDAGEFVEIVIQDIVTNLPADFDIDLYNDGTGGTSYDVFNLDSDCTPAATVGDYEFFNCATPDIQNGDPDGLALSYQGTLIAGQFLSYDGSFTATNGPANGVTSTDVGVGETGSTPLGVSLQLIGVGTMYSDFTWTGPRAESPGAENSGQTITAGSDLVVTCMPVNPPISIPDGGGDYFYVLGVTNTGAVASSFDVWVDIDGTGTDLTFGPYTNRTLAPGASLARQYRKNVPPGAPPGDYIHTCKVGAFPAAAAGSFFTFTKTAPPELHGSAGAVAFWPMDDEVAVAYVTDARADVPTEFTLDAAYPNPFNPEATFRFAATEQQNVRADLVNVLGRVVATLFEGNVEAGEMQTVRIDGTGLPSGTYVVRLVGETFSDARRLTLLK